MTRNKLRTAQRFRYSLGIVGLQLVTTGLFVFLSTSDNVLVWVVGQAGLGICFLQWFFLLHEIAHASFLPHKGLAIFFGHIAAFFSLIPYYPWKHVHNEHHKWTGWKEKDPTIPVTSINSVPERAIKIIDFCWKYWIPAIALSYVVTTFYHVKKLKHYFNDQRRKRLNHISILVNALGVFMLVGLFGFLFFKVWLVAFLFYLTLSDPYLLAQHTHLDYMDLEKNELVPVKYMEQDLFSRTIKFPAFIERYILFYSNLHGVHHQYPWLASYELKQAPVPAHNKIKWGEWLRKAKKLKGHELVFLSTRDTGVSL